jgi:ferrous iron transport protein B
MSVLQTQSPEPNESSLRSPIVALVGNPNAGKSTLFNRLTGVRQKTANYPGVTVEKKTGTMIVDGQSVTAIDLPGTYTLAAASADERIVVDALTGHAGMQRPDVAVCVADATNLMRHLFLAAQVADTGVPIVIAVNMIDAAHEKGLAIDTHRLSESLGVPVVPLSASKNRGIEELRSAIGESLKTQARLKSVEWPDTIGGAIDYLRGAIPADQAEKLTLAELQRILFDHDSAVADRVGWTAQQRDQHIAHAQHLLREKGLEPCAAEPTIRYAFLGERMEGVVTQPSVRKASGTESIDKLLTHRLWGLIIFAALMYGVFWSIYTAAGPLMDGIDWLFGSVGDWAGGMLEGMPMIQSLVVDGIIAGVGGVVIFLPQILILFFFIALLEATGYMSRAAFLMDKLFSWCGLNGKSFVPLLSSYACAIPGILAARTIDNPRARITTVFIAPLMSCSARLPVYVLLIAAFVEPAFPGSAWVPATVLFAMHLLGLVIAVPIAFVMNRLIFRTHRTPFVLEMPSYRVPNVRDVLWRMWERGLDFLKTAGTVIFAMAIVIWAMSYFPRPDSVATETTETFVQQVAEEQGVALAQTPALIDANDELTARLDQAIEGAYLEQSVLGRVGKTIQPIFAPAGFDWKITVGVVGSFPAREVIIATLGITYSLGGDVDEESEGLKAAMLSSTWPDGSPVFTLPVALAVMVFFALCLQCGATVAIIGREIGWSWAIGAFVFMTVLAWVGAVATYQIGTALSAA